MPAERIDKLQLTFERHERLDAWRFVCLVALILVSTLALAWLFERGNRRVVRNQERITVLADEARLQRRLVTLLQDTNDLHAHQMRVVIRQLNDLKAEVSRRTPIFGRLRREIRSLKRGKR